MRPQQFAIGLVKPVKSTIFRRVIKATDKAWREAIFGMGGSRKRIGGAKIGAIDGQPIAVIVELPEEADQSAAAWTVTTDAGVWGFIGPGAIYNDAGFGPASLGLPIERLKEVVAFDPEPEALQEALRRTLQSRGQEKLP